MQDNNNNLQNNPVRRSIRNSINSTQKLISEVKRKTPSSNISDRSVKPVSGGILGGVLSSVSSMTLLPNVSLTGIGMRSSISYTRMGKATYGIDRYMDKGRKGNKDLYEEMVMMLLYTLIGTFMGYLMGFAIDKYIDYRIDSEMWHKKEIRLQQIVIEVITEFNNLINLLNNPTCSNLVITLKKQPEFKQLFVNTTLLDSEKNYMLPSKGNYKTQEQRIMLHNFVMSFFQYAQQLNQGGAISIPELNHLPNQMRAINVNREQTFINQDRYDDSDLSQNIDNSLLPVTASQQGLLSPTNSVKKKKTRKAPHSGNSAIIRQDHQSRLAAATPYWNMPFSTSYELESNNEQELKEDILKQVSAMEPDQPINITVPLSSSRELNISNDNDNHFLIKPTNTKNNIYYLIPKEYDGRMQNFMNVLERKKDNLRYIPINNSFGVNNCIIYNSVANKCYIKFKGQEERLHFIPFKCNNITIYLPSQFITSKEMHKIYLQPQHRASTLELKKFEDKPGIFNAALPPLTKSLIPSLAKGAKGAVLS